MAKPLPKAVVSPCGGPQAREPSVAGVPAAGSVATNAAGAEAGTNALPPQKRPKGVTESPYQSDYAARRAIRGRERKTPQKALHGQIRP